MVISETRADGLEIASHEGHRTKISAPLAKQVLVKVVLLDIRHYKKGRKYQVNLGYLVILIYRRRSKHFKVFKIVGFRTTMPARGHRTKNTV